MWNGDVAKIRAEITGLIPTVARGIFGEVGVLTDADIENYKKELANNLKGIEPQTLLHDSVFVKIDKASKLFQIIVLKTEEVIPYSSVFIQLDCRYWSGEKEKALRELMK